MFEMLMNFVFTLIGKIGDLILTPLVSAISVFIPGFGNFLNYIVQFLEYALTYFVFLLKLLMIPKECLQIVVTVAFASLSIMTAFRSYHLIMMIYNKFKP